nr:serine:threonine protein phosphatase 2A [Hymenolepis microstoma]
MFRPIVTDPIHIDELFTKKVRDEARASLLEAKSAGLLDNEDLADLWNILEKYKDASTDNGRSFITYPNFLKAKDEACPKAKQYFTATIFAKLCHGERFSRVNILSFFNYVMKTVWLQQTRIGISLYDAHGDGYLREGDLESYISELIPSLCKDTSSPSWSSKSPSTEYEFSLDSRLDKQKLTPSKFLEIDCQVDTLTNESSLKSKTEESTRNPEVIVRLSETDGSLVDESSTLEVNESASNKVEKNCDQWCKLNTLSTITEHSYESGLPTKSSILIPQTDESVSASKNEESAESEVAKLKKLEQYPLSASWPVFELFWAPLYSPNVQNYLELNGVDDAFRTFYVCTAVRKFLFFLDPLRAGRVRICDILACGFLDNILELREASTTQARLEENWFSLESAKRVYASYLRLDTDQNGMLSRKELAGYNNESLTDAFLDRVFQECLTYEGEMDYKVYLDFVLAMENRSEPQSIAYIFRIVDLGGQGRLCVKTVEYYLNSLLESLGDGPDTPRICDIINEIFDMIRPKHPDYITLDDLLRSGKGDTVLGILTDVQCFMLYENREALAAGIQADM